MKLPLLSCALAALSAFTSQGTAAAVITANVSFNAGTSKYLYSYSITNTGLMEDLALITVAGDPLGALMDTMAPSGFSLTFDSSQGSINFTEDTSIITPQTFGPGTTVTGFSYTSIFSPTSTAYSAFDSAGTEFTGFTSAPIPEPTGLTLLTLACTATALRRRRSS